MGWFYRSVSEVFFHPEQIYPTLWDRETDHHVFTGYLAQFSRRETRHENIGPQFYLLIKIKNRVRACGCWNEDVTLSSKQKRILIRKIQVQWCWILFTVGTCMFFFLFFFFVNEKWHYLITGNAHYSFKLKRKLSVFRRPYSKSHKFDITCIWWLEPSKVLVTC